MRRDPDVERLLGRLVDGHRRVLGPALEGSYLFGSAVTEDYEPGVSDVDTVSVLRAEPTFRQLADLEALHRDLVDEVLGMERPRGMRVPVI